MLSLAIDGTQWGVLLNVGSLLTYSFLISIQLASKLPELRLLIEARLIAGTLMMTHSRGLLAKTIEGYRVLFSPEAFSALQRLIESVNKVDYVKVLGADIKQQHELNIAILGDKTTGKSTLRTKFSQQLFDKIDPSEGIPLKFNFLISYNYCEMT